MKRPAPGCTGKVAYPSKATAKRELRWLKKRRRCWWLEIYPCRHCGGWHIGTPRVLKEWKEVQS